MNTKKEFFIKNHEEKMIELERKLQEVNNQKSELEAHYKRIEIGILKKFEEEKEKASKCKCCSNSMSVLINIGICFAKLFKSFFLNENVRVYTLIVF